MERNDPRPVLCDVCKVRKSDCVTVGMDSGNGYRNRNVCMECLPMLGSRKKGEGNESS
jgi:hypothetical protein